MNATMKKILTACLALVAMAALCGPLCGPVTAQNQASSDLLLPYFEVDGANPGGLTTLFAVGNSTDQLVEVVAAVHTNWGIPILEVPFTLQAREIRTVNLRDWFRQGGDPKKALSAAEVQHLVAAASGQRSPKDSLYYSTEIRPDLVVGYVTLRTQGNRPDALWGDWFNVDVAGNLARGDVLANIDRSSGCPGLCHRHLLRYLSGGGFDGGTEVIVWRENSGHPSAFEDGGVKMQATATAFDEPGQPIENRDLFLLPVEKVLVSELGLKEPFGALDVETEEETFFAVQHTAENRYSVGLTTYCLPRKLHPGPGISIVKATNGEDADKAPGPSIPIGGAVTWDYLVTNTGNVELTDIVVVDDQEGAVSCPRDSLPAGDSMTCSKSGTAKACQYSNVGSVSALDPSGTEVNDSDPSHYFGGGTGAAIAFSAVKVNGVDAGTEPGPAFDVNTDLNVTFTLTNTGEVRLTGVLLSGTSVTCSKTALDPNEATDCTFTLKAASGKHSLPVTAKGNGGAACSEASTSATAFYEGLPQSCSANPAITIKTATNGDDANTGQGPSIQAGSSVFWTYLVTNTGDITLDNVKVTDSKGVAVSCPKSSLAAGEAMTCTASGIAVIGQYDNIGKATGAPASPCNPVSAEDPSHYYGVDKPDITIVKKTNGQDANTAPGPEIAVGDPVLWEYVVTNIGKITLTGVAVTDDKGVAVTCPKTTLKVDESMTCTGSGTALACQYQNLGTATGTAYGGQKVSASDPSHYFGKSNPAIEVEAKINGDHADTPKGPEFAIGATVPFTYWVKNTGDTTLTGITVVDSKGVAVTCPKTSLTVGESMFCSGSGIAQAGQYSAIATATGTGSCGQKVSGDDPVHYFGKNTENPAIKIVKKTNGQDANTAPGPEIAVGSTVTWTYIVTNIGDVALSNVKVTDDKGVAVTCPKTTLAVNESMTCTGSGKAVACQYTNIGTATGKSPAGQTVSANDPSNYYGKTYPAIEVEAKINGDHADTPKGPEFWAGSTVPFTYWVKNTGDTTLTGITVVDSKGVAVTCPKSSLTPGESMFCSGSAIAQAGQYSATATATGTGSCGQKVSDDDPVHYYGKSKVYDEGCSHGYWKTHSSSWPATGYSTSQKVSSVWSQASLYSSLSNSSLLSSLSFSGGSDLTGAAANLLKQATASLLNSAHDDIDFPYSTSKVISDVNAALASKNSSTILALASDLDDANNLGCPLN